MTEADIVQDDDQDVGGASRSLDLLGKISLNCSILLRITSYNVCYTKLLRKGISREIIENLTSGYNHAMVGARLAEKWNFPDNLVKTIMHHHNPLEADELTRLVVDALRISKQRAVMLGGWTDLGGSGLPDNILKVDHVPHDSYNFV